LDLRHPDNIRVFITLRDLFYCKYQDFLRRKSVTLAFVIVVIFVVSITVVIEVLVTGTWEQKLTRVFCLAFIGFLSLFVLAAIVLGTTINLVESRYTILFDKTYLEVLNAMDEPYRSYRHGMEREEKKSPRKECKYEEETIERTMPKIVQCVEDLQNCTSEKGKVLSLTLLYAIDKAELQDQSALTRTELKSAQRLLQSQRESLRDRKKLLSLLGVPLTSGFLFWILGVIVAAFGGVIQRFVFK